MLDASTVLVKLVHDPFGTLESSAHMNRRQSQILFEAGSQCWGETLESRTNPQQ